MKDELSFLVVDDDPADVKSVCRFLSHAGISRQTDSVSTLEQAKQKIRRHRYDAVILDLGLPDSQGVDGVMDFQATAPELPVVVLTGCEDDNTALRSMNVGAEDFLNKKSLTEDKLCRALRYAIERHRRKRETYQDIDALRVSLGDAMHQASTDALTGLPNRRSLQQYLIQLERSRPNNPVIVGLADLDHFKAINDALGHHFGDVVLREFSARIQHCMRSTDFAARIGGDEFVIVFGDLSRAAAADLGRRIVEHVASSPAHEADHDIPFTVTLALAELELPFVDLEQILIQTHDLLAQAKGDGKNRVQCAWGDDPAPSRPATESLTALSKPETVFPSDLLVQKVREVRPLAMQGSLGQYLIFGLGSSTWPMVAPAISHARLSNTLSQMTIHCMERAVLWRQANARGAVLHLDIEADAVKPWVCIEMNRIFPTEAERSNCVLFLHTDFPSQPGAASLADLRLLRQAGFKIGVRNVGDGSTILEHLQLLGPEWIRFDPALTIHAASYEKKADALRQTVEMLRPLGAQLLVDECSDEDRRQLDELGFHAYYS